MKNILLLSIVVALFTVFSVKADKVPQKTIFAHYMGCYPLDKFGNPTYKYDKPDYMSAIGGRHCNPPLLPPDLKLDEVEAAALDIRRAMRAGIDGFAIDVLAGRERGVRTLDMLFKAAEKYDLPFQITFCLDASYRNPGAIKLLLDKYGKSKKLALRNGKVLFFSYHTRDAKEYLKEYLDYKKNGVRKEPPGYKRDTNFAGLPQLPRDHVDFPELSNVMDLWRTPAGFAAHGKVVKHYQQRFNTPLFLQFELSSFIRWGGNFNGKEGRKRLKTGIAALARDYDCLGAFLPTTYLSDKEVIELSEIARKNNCEWGEALCYQYDNDMWERYHVGTVKKMMLERWKMIDATKSTLLQFTTWNDYAENTQLAPAWETRYTYLDLNAYFVERWKTGKEPVVNDDRIYAIYPHYQFGAEDTCVPFRVYRRAALSKPLEIITILKAPAVVSLPGRNAVWTAPAGFSVKELPGTPGPVKVELHRDKKLVKKLDCPDPIADRIFRVQVTPTCYSTEFMKHWRADFGNTPPAMLDGWYGDKDRDGLPNWFEMVYFGKFNDFSNITAAAPGDDPDKDGFTNLQEYQNCTDPTKPDNVPYPAGYAWDLIRDLLANLSFNPDLDSHRAKVWFYQAFTGKGKLTPGSDLRLTTLLNRKPKSGDNWYYQHRFPMNNRDQMPWKTEIVNPNAPQMTITHRWEKSRHDILLSPGKKSDAVIAWRSPVDGNVKIAVSLSGTRPTKDVKFSIETPRSGSRSITVSGKKLFKETISASTVKKGDYIYFRADRNSSGTAVVIKALSIKLLK